MRIKIIYLLKIFLIFSMLSCSNMQWDDLVKKSDIFVDKNMNKNGKVLLAHIDKRNKKNRENKITLTGGGESAESLEFLMLKGSWLQLSMLNEYFEIVPFLYIQPLEEKKSEIKEGTESIFKLNESLGIWASQNTSIVYKTKEDNIYEIVFQKKNREFNQKEIKKFLLELEILDINEMNKIEKQGIYL